jgi:hypothetical protein
MIKKLGKDIKSKYKKIKDSLEFEEDIENHLYIDRDSKPSEIVEQLELHQKNFENKIITDLNPNHNLIIKYYAEKNNILDKIVNYSILQSVKEIKFITEDKYITNLINKSFGYKTLNDLNKTKETYNTNTKYILIEEKIEVINHYLNFIPNYQIHVISSSIDFNLYEMCSVRNIEYTVINEFSLRELFKILRDIISKYGELNNNKHILLTDKFYLKVLDEKIHYAFFVYNIEDFIYNKRIVRERQFYSFLIRKDNFKYLSLYLSKNKDKIKFIFEVICCKIFVDLINKKEADHSDKILINLINSINSSFPNFENLKKTLTNILEDSTLNKHNGSQDYKKVSFLSIYNPKSNELQNLYNKMLPLIMLQTFSNIDSHYIKRLIQKSKSIVDKNNFQYEVFSQFNFHSYSLEHDNLPKYNDIILAILHNGFSNITYSKAVSFACNNLQLHNQSLSKEFTLQDRHDNPLILRYLHFFYLTNEEIISDELDQLYDNSVIFNFSYHILSNGIQCMHYYDFKLFPINCSLILYYLKKNKLHSYFKIISYVLVNFSYDIKTINHYNKLLGIENIEN